MKRLRHWITEAIQLVREFMETLYSGVSDDMYYEGFDMWVQEGDEQDDV